MIAFGKSASESARNFAFGCALALLGRPEIRERASLGHAGLILMLHHVRPRNDSDLGCNRGITITPETLSHLLGSLSAHGYELVSMDEAADRVAGALPPRRFAALTFDDGCRDNLIHAAPILMRYGAPFTVYVTTGFTDGTVAPWWHVVERAVSVASALVVELAEGKRSFNCSSSASKRRAAIELRDLLWRASEGRRADLCRSLAAQAAIDTRALTRGLYLDWSELRDLSEIPGCEIGVHTHSHPKLAELDEAAARREICEPRDAIRERLGLHARHLSFPYGGADSCGEREFSLARQAGFATAVTTRRGLLSSAAEESLANLPRVPINGHFQRQGMIDALVSGLPMALASRTGGLLRAS